MLRNMDKLITIFTPTFNRAHLLNRCYESLHKQKKFNFVWLIVDDGSQDNTKELCVQWQKTELNFPIKYIYKENGGLHTAYNTAIPMANTKVFCCLESDDFFTPDATTIIEELWKTVESNNCTGFISLSKDTEGRIIGGEFQSDVKFSSFLEHRHLANGDKQYVYRTEVLKKIFPQKVFAGEKYFDPNYQLSKELDKYGVMLVTNQVFVIADYQDNGLTGTMFRQYLNSPNSFAEYRRLEMCSPYDSFFRKYVINIHYVSSCILAKQYRTMFRDSPKKLLTFLALIPGVALTSIVLITNSLKV